MKKIKIIIVIFCIATLVLPIQLSMADEDIIEWSISVEKPKIEEKNEYVLVKLKDCSFLMETGKPIIPMITKTFTFPAGTKITDVIIDIDKEEYKLPKKIEPSPTPIPLCNNFSYNFWIDEEIYSSKELYPKESYNIRKGAGLKDWEHVIYLNIKCYAQYSPAMDTIYIPKNINIKIKYKLPSEPVFKNDEYDLLIITDKKFEQQFQRLVEHKNSIGIRTILITTQEIYPKYNGRDEAEDIKLAIKDAIEKYGIKYVLLAGGRKGQTFDWYIPERRSNNQAEPPWSRISESGYASDLYYADIYDANGDFEDWDSNGNGIFAEFSYYGEKRDEIDYYPDVYVGRLPIRYSWEADIVIDKIINYENKAGNWFKHAFMIAGDTSPPARDTTGIIKRGVYEGEIVADVAASYLESKGFSIEKLYTSTGKFENYEDVVNAFNTGAGFIYCSGHGNPGVWGNFLPDAETEEEFALGFTVFDIWKYSNGYMLPIVVVGGCHNAQFNVTMQHIIEKNEEAIWHGEYYPHDGCSWMLLEENGGSIASIGYTGYGYGYVNEYCTMGLGGWIEPRFFHAYAIQGKEHLGEIHSQAIIDYINIVDNVDYDHIDRKTIESWALLGDPSLKVGGIGTITINKEKIGKENNKFIGYDDVPVWEKGMNWKYKISNIDFLLDEVEGRYVEFHFKSGNFYFKVVDVTADTYVAEFELTDADLKINVDFEKEIENPIKIAAHIHNSTAKGKIYFDRTNLGIKEINVNLQIKVDLSSLNLSLPPILEKLLKFIPFVIKVNLKIDFSHSYPIIDFPLETGKSWGLPAVNITIDGTIRSIWFWIIAIVNKVTSIFGIQILPPEIAKLLPIIRIPELLNAFNIPNEIEIPQMIDPLYHDIHLFKCASKEKISVKAGTFTAYDIQMVRAIGQIYYSPDVENVVKIIGNFNDIVPIIKDVSMELVSYSK